MKTRKRNWFKRLTDIFFRPKYFFSKIVADGKMEDAMLRAFLWGLIGGVLVLIMQLVRGNPFTFLSLFKAIIVNTALTTVVTALATIDTDGDDGADEKSDKIDALRDAKDAARTYGISIRLVGDDGNQITYGDAQTAQAELKHASDLESNSMQHNAFKKILFRKSLFSAHFIYSILSKRLH